ncbi:MAG: thioredoxin domain-containing protein [Polyangiales bacterium]
MTARRANALAGERSPYLLQHAHNPVDWLPWGDAAFEKARAEDRPVFLSIGYSACHWCHVMERESFEDEATAALLNARFVCVKVDREERPDVDQVYQLAHQAISSRGGGWPLSVFLTADRKPFYSGTYFPPERRHGMPSFSEVLGAMLEAWDARRGDVTEQAREVAEALDAHAARARKPGDAPDDVLSAAVTHVLPRADLRLGGFGRAPKFPNTMTLDLLMGAAALHLPEVGERAREVVAVTLDAMARGGIHDHLGGGFARYSTDAQWHVPHFEKMLYDNAQLLRLYADGARLLGGDGAARHEATARALVAYLTREMTSPEGAFYSAQDADSEGEEGRFFAWTRDEFRAVAGDDADAACAWFDVTAEGNWEHGNNVLWTPRPLAEIAAALGRPEAEVLAAVARARPRLFEAREKRPKPLRDDKCLASWNALCLGALADAGAALGEDAWVTAAARCLALWRSRAWQNGALAHAMKDGVAYGHGFLDDHAGMAGAALDVFEANHDPAALAFARELGDAVLARFVDDATGELCFTPSDGEAVLYRSRDPHDQAHPGGYGLALDALLRLATITGDARYREAAERAAAPVAATAAANPMGLATVARAADRVRRGAVEVIVMGDASRDDTKAVLRAARGVMLPHRTLVCAASAEAGAAAGIDAHLLEGRSAGAGGAPVAFVCRGTACEMPARTPEGLAATLRRVTGTAG